MVSERERRKTMAGGELGEQAVKVTFSTIEITATTIKAIIEALLKNKNTSYIEHGKQSLKKLNQQNRKLEKVDLSKEDIKSFKRELNRYHVDFSIMRDKESGLYSIYFKSQDIDRVHSGLQNCIKSYSKNIKRPIKETIEVAKQKAEDRAEQSKASAKEKSAERGKDER